MEFQKVFEALEDALRTKDLMIDIYKRERDEARQEVVELLHKIEALEELQNVN